MVNCNYSAAARSEEFEESCPCISKGREEDREHTQITTNSRLQGNYKHAFRLKGLEHQEVNTFFFMKIL